MIGRVLAATMSAALVAGCTPAAPFNGTQWHSYCMWKDAAGVCVSARVKYHEPKVPAGEYQASHQDSDACFMAQAARADGMSPEAGAEAFRGWLTSECGLDVFSVEPGRDVEQFEEPGWREREASDKQQQRTRVEAGIDPALVVHVLGHGETGNRYMPGNQLDILIDTADLAVAAKLCPAYRPLAVELGDGQVVVSYYDGSAPKPLELVRCMGAGL